MTARRWRILFREAQEIGGRLPFSGQAHRDDFDAQQMCGLEEIVDAHQVVIAADAHLRDRGVGDQQVDLIAGVDLPQDFVEALAAGFQASFEPGGAVFRLVGVMGHACDEDGVVVAFQPSEIARDQIHRTATGVLSLDIDGIGLTAVGMELNHLNFSASHGYRHYVAMRRNIKCGA